MVYILVKIREALMLNTVEVIRLQVHLPHLKTLLLGSCYRPPSANSQYLDNMCKMLDNVCVINREVYFLGDLNNESGFHQAAHSRKSFKL